MLIEPMTLPCEVSGAARSDSEPRLSRQFRIAILLLVVDVRNDDRMPLPDHKLDQRSFHADRHAMHIVRRRAARRTHRQLFLLIVDQQDRTHRGVERLGQHLRNRLQNALEIAFRGNRLRHRGQRFHAPHRACDCSASLARAITPPICSPMNVTSATSSLEC